MKSAKMAGICSTRITMPCRLGLHMRAAVRFMKYARQFRSEIRIRKGRLVSDAKSIFGILLLGATWKSKLEICAIGEDAKQAIRAIEGYFLQSESCVDNAG